MNSSAPVLVLGAHHGSLGIARSLGRLGVAVYGVHHDMRERSLSSRYFRDMYKWNFATESPAQSVAFLLALRRKFSVNPVLIPTSDDLAQLVADNRDALLPAYRFQNNDPKIVRALSQKKELYFLARRHGIPTATTLFPDSLDEVRRYAEHATFPLVLKASDGLRSQSRTGRKMVIVRSAAELVEEYARLEDPAAPNMMLQEYIPGGDDTIWMFNGYFNGNSECVAGFTGRKLRQHPVHVGSTSLGVCEENAHVRATTVRFMHGLGYRGILDIGFRWDARDGTYKLLDPNPRIGSTFRLFVGPDGTDVARLLYLDLTGQPLPSTSLVVGRKWMVEDRDLESSLDYRREGTLSLVAWLRSFRGVREAAWFAWDDPVPFLIMARQCVARAVRRAWHSVFRGRPAQPIVMAAAASTEATLDVPAALRAGGGRA